MFAIIQLRILLRIDKLYHNENSTKMVQNLLTYYHYIYIKSVLLFQTTIPTRTMSVIDRDLAVQLKVTGILSCVCGDTHIRKYRNSFTV